MGWSPGPGRPCYHNGVAGVDDSAQVFHAVRPLDLGHDARCAVDVGVALGLVYDHAQVEHILRGARKAEGDPVNPQPHHKGSVGPVLVRQRRDGQQGIGHIDALAQLDGPAVDRATVDVVGDHRLDLQFDVAVVNEDRPTRFDVGGQVEVHGQDHGVGGKGCARVPTGRSPCPPG